MVVLSVAWTEHCSGWPKAAVMVVLRAGRLADMKASIWVANLVVVWEHYSAAVKAMKLVLTLVVTRVR